MKLKHFCELAYKRKAKHQIIITNKICNLFTMFIGSSEYGESSNVRKSETSNDDDDDQSESSVEAFKFHSVQLDDMFTPQYADMERRRPNEQQQQMMVLQKQSNLFEQQSELIKLEKEKLLLEIEVLKFKKEKLKLENAVLRNKHFK